MSMKRRQQKAYNGILKIFSGAAGGTTGLFTMLVTDIIGAEREKVEIMRDGRQAQPDRSGARSRARSR